MRSSGAPALPDRRVVRQASVYRETGCRSKQSDQGINKEFYFTSLSGTTVVYKALTRADALDRFYLDLKTPGSSPASRCSIAGSAQHAHLLDKAQPFRLIAHNGEINTIAGNRSRASPGKNHSVSRGPARHPCRDQRFREPERDGRGTDVQEQYPADRDLLAIMMPPAHGQSDYYKFWSRAMEPWDGPAIIMYSDGRSIGARLDRNGFRPSAGPSRMRRSTSPPKPEHSPLMKGAYWRKGSSTPGPG